MIVHPDFLDHRKTRKLVSLSGDTHAPFWVLRLWAYCQRQRGSVFDSAVLSGRLASVCDAPISSDQLLTFFLDSGFVRREGERLVVHDWEEVNRMLVSAWANGSRGGRPASNKPGANRRETDRKPDANRSTRARVGEEDKIRAGSRPVISGNPSDQPAEAGPLAGGIKAGKLQLAANSETDSADVRRREALRKFGGLSNAVAQALKPPDNQ